MLLLLLLLLGLLVHLLVLLLLLHLGLHLHLQLQLLLLLQNPAYEPYGYGAQKVQKRAKNTSKLHCSSHSYAHTIIFYVVIIIQMHTIPTQAPNMRVDGDR